MNTPTPEEASKALNWLHNYAFDYTGEVVDEWKDTLRRFIDAHSAQPEPVAWRVYFPDEQRQEYCDHLDELIEDLTNCRHDDPEPLYASPPPAQPAQADPVPRWWTCDTHGAPPRPNAWGCPECVSEMRQELAALGLTW